MKEVKGASGYYYQHQWIPFLKDLGIKQILPPTRKKVLVTVQLKFPHCITPRGLSVGYLKFAGGDENCPYFVIPGIGGEVLSWNDCLPNHIIEGT